MKLFGHQLETLEVLLLAGLAGVGGHFVAQKLDALAGSTANLTLPVHAEPIADRPDIEAEPVAIEVKPNLVQVALILDVSGSMDGLISQARAQLWQTAIALGSLQRDGRGVELELALYAYGMNGNGDEGYLAQISPFTRDLDAFGHSLFALQTSGSEEFSGMVLERSLHELAWSDDPEAMRLIYLAGNESIFQGPVNIGDPLAQAQERDISVHLIYCGDDNGGDVASWRQAAQRTGSALATIDHNAAVEEAKSPFDEEIAQLGAALNDTYVGRGAGGRAMKARQESLDKLSAKEGMGTKRMIAKGSGVYEADWDLVQQVAKNKVAVESLAPSELPPEMQNLAPAAIKDEIAKKAAKREEIRNKLADLNRKREAHLAETAASDDGNQRGLGNALDKSLADHASQKGYIRQ
jgi:hypothetical protein